MVCLISAGQHQRNELGWEQGRGRWGQWAKTQESLVANGQTEAMVFQYGGGSTVVVDDL